VLALIALCTLPTVAVAATDVAAAKPRVEIQKAEDGGGLKSLLDQVWARLRSYGPTASNDHPERNATLVAGVRGAEVTSSALKPYWKGDKSNDPAFLEEVGAYNKAQGLADAGDLKGASAAFDGFLKTYPASTLKPNAVFALGLAYAGLGDKAKGLSFLKTFVKDYPTHPLAGDAGRLIERM